ncbi:unnamed protein product [Durusdinium trenchii]|uniref:Uncharacterized protein n=1 Tax=Durusdinium trenchii TaxID=1381693 RepID=A0ABP0H6K5_9DINO
MGKKGKDAAPEVVEDPPEEEERETAPELPPEAASKILQDLDWEVCVMPAQKQRYFYSKSRRQARYQPPYHSILGLEEAKYQDLTKDELWKAFYLKRQVYKKPFPDGALSEELKDPKDQVDWSLILESFQVLSQHEARSVYEQRNLVPHAQLELIGLVVMHEQRLVDEAERRAKEEKAAREAAEAE